MTTAGKELLRVQKKQFELGLLWISVINNPETTPEDLKIAIGQYVELLAMISKVQFETLNIDVTKLILEC